MTLNGVIRNLVGNRRFGFIRAGKDDYFFHADDISEEWSVLVQDYAEKKIEVVFEPTKTPKGLRARNVQRSYMSEGV